MIKRLLAKTESLVDATAHVRSHQDQRPTSGSLQPIAHGLGDGPSKAAAPELGNHEHDTDPANSSMNRSHAGADDAAVRDGNDRV